MRRFTIIKIAKERSSGKLKIKIKGDGKKCTIYGSGTPGKWNGNALFPFRKAASDEKKNKTEISFLELVEHYWLAYWEFS